MSKYVDMNRSQIADMAKSFPYVIADMILDQKKDIENLKMVCRRLAAAKTLESRDRIAEMCLDLFIGTITREESDGSAKTSV